jgi:phytoene dehydrogenase-like protein
VNRTAYVVGSGPNGLTAAIELARAGLRVTVLEAQPTLGGGARTLPLTLPGFRHDICSAAHPMAVSSAAFASMPLREHGLEWIHSPAPLVHPFDDGTAATLERKPNPDWLRLASDLLGPPGVPKHPVLFARFAARAPWSAITTAQHMFHTPKERALFAGIAAHSVLPLQFPFVSAIAWPLYYAGQAVGWPIAKGGSQSITDALLSYFASLGGRTAIHHEVRSLDELRDAGIIMCDISPRQLLRIAGDRLPLDFARKLERYRYGPGVFKMDWALDAPIPWTAPECARTATVHLGNTLEEIAGSELAAYYDKRCGTPFVLLVQPSLFDSTRAPAGKHTAWAYCHVPNGSNEDFSARIEAQVERFAPGFQATILARSAMSAAVLEEHNANLIGGDITGGANTFPQLLLRPTRHLYRTPVNGLYLCSASTPPGGGVHGMCGYNAARAALADLRD